MPMASSFCLLVFVVATRSPVIALAPRCSPTRTSFAPLGAAGAHDGGPESSSRRGLLGGALRTFGSTVVGTSCSCCHPSPASALTQLQTPPREAVEAYDVYRDKLQDAAFACGMSTGMESYERAAASNKEKTFRRLLRALPRNDAVILEVGMGSFPNAPFFAMPEAPGGMDIIGIDPNDSMKGYAVANARRVGLLAGSATPGLEWVPGGGAGKGNSVRVVHGVSEALPFADASVDAVVCSLTLCSVASPETSVAEIQRVLKPGGQFLFWEHVLSATDEAMAARQVAATPSQVRRADGCHLDRRTGETIRRAGFEKLDLEYLELAGFGVLNPTVSGIATA